MIHFLSLRIIPHRTIINLYFLNSTYAFSRSSKWDTRSGSFALQLFYAPESKGVSLRVEKLSDEVEKLEEEEMNKQKRYGELMHEKNRLLLKINGQGKKPSS